MSKGNVIDMTKRREQQKTDVPSEAIRLAAPVLDMSLRREEILKQERRKVRRTILAEFLGAFVLVPGRGLQKVMIYDISDEGLSFDLDFEVGHFERGEEYAMRLYLSHDTYLPFTVRISHYREEVEEACYRHGVEFLKDTTNKEALYHFVKFLENVTASLHTDKGDIQVSKLK